MRLLIILALSLGLVVMFGAPLAAQATGTGIATVGSPHNFTDNDPIPELPGAGGWNGREEICRVCHVPHDHGRATRYGDNGLLWNHEVSSASYTMYSSATLDGAQQSQPTGFSKLCLACHDGSIAIDTFDKYTGGTVHIGDYEAGFQIPGSGFTGDLTSTHPLSIEYDPGADPNLKPLTTAMGGSGTIEDVLEGGLVQCSSCHDVHDQPGESVTGTHLLRVDTKSPPSGLCLTCHIK